MSKDSITITIPKELFERKYVTDFIEKLELEKRMQTLDVDEDKLLSVAEEIKSDWWTENKAAYLEGVNENHC